jgi:hypothetical protein
MKLTDEEIKELRELYESYKDTKDVDSLKLLGGLIRTSKWYKNHKITLQCMEPNLLAKKFSTCGEDFYYINLTIHDLLIKLCDQIIMVSGKERFIILDFLYRLIHNKNFLLYKPI